MSRSDCTLLDQPIVLRFMFYPRRDFRPPQEGLDVFFEVAPDIRVGGRLYTAEKDSPVVLLFHGNGEIASDYDGIAPLYTRMGISLLVADYRGYGQSDGTPTASALLDDALAIFGSLRDVLSERGLGDSRLFLMGRSLGSAAALEIASTLDDNISGLIIESGFASALGLIERLSGPLPLQLQGEAGGFNNAEKIERIDLPTLIIHGEADQIIPVTDGKALFNHCPSKQKRFVVISGAGHNDLLLFGQELYFEAVREFVLK